jgi:CDP-4-dehydro-6-deoxyglucose reductase, E1
MATTINSPADKLRGQILDLVRQYHAEAFPQKTFVPDRSNIPYAGRVFDADEIVHLTEATLDFWLTTGRFAQQFEEEIASWCGLRHAMLVNSGSSATLLALTCLTASELGERALRPGDEVITVAAGFPTTVNPIIQNGLIPVFVDISVPTYNIDVSQLEDARSDRTRAIMLAHTLGNPFNLDAITDFAKRHNLWLIEDCCDALGSTYRGKKVGNFGDVATLSFYPAHHITMGEGGCVLTNDDKLRIFVESFRDWGRACWCAPGKDNTCGKRFQWQSGGLPCGYDHKFTYSHIGYNLKLTDMQAAVGVAQLRKLPQFIAARRQNFTLLRDGFTDLEEFFILPEATANSDPSWFGFPVAVRPDAPFKRESLIKHLDAHKISTRLLFGGNLTCQPAYQDCRFRVVGDLKNTNFAMDHVFWLGVYPGLTTAMIDHILGTVHTFVNDSTACHAAI